MRTHPKYQRIYVNGYDLSGTGRQLGTLGETVQETPGAAFSDGCMNVVVGRSTLVCGPLNAFLAPAVSPAVDSFELLSTGTLTAYVMALIGSINGPLVGDPVFCAAMEQVKYTAEPSDEMIAASIDFSNASALGSLNYSSPFGLLTATKATRTGANTAVGTIDNGAASVKGGVFIYQLFSSDGTVTLSLDDSATNSNNAAFAALTGATSGSIDASVAPKYGMVELSNTATVRRYLRWQLALGTANTCVFASAFIRGK